MVKLSESFVCVYVCVCLIHPHKNWNLSETLLLYNVTHLLKHILVTF